MVVRCLSLLLAVLVSEAAVAQTSPFTVADALSAPFMNQLTAAPAKNRVAWFVDEEGRRNVWAASPTEKARALTHYIEDDGQDIDGITWAPDGEAVAYTRGTGPDGSEHPTAANPAHLQEEVKQRVEIATWNGAVRIVGEGHAPVFSVDGKRLFFLRHGQVWSDDVTKPEAAPEQLIIARGTVSALRPSPDGLRLAFVSHREDHSFIGVFTFGGNRAQGTANSGLSVENSAQGAGTGSLVYVDPGTGLDHDPVWSPDSKRIAFIRESPVETELDLRWMRSVPVPWSIRIADVATGDGKQVWQADAGTGSMFREMVAKNQLLWMKDGRIVFPWEKTGWLHLYSLTAGAISAKLLTPGDFEVDNVVTDGERIVYSSNQLGDQPKDARDLDRRHLWVISTSTDQPKQLTKGSMLETSPALLSGGYIAALQASAQQPFAPLFLQEMNGVICAGACVPWTSIAQAVQGSPEVPKKFSGNQFVMPQQKIFSAADGLRLHGQLFLPPNAKPGEKLPTIVFFHGGSRRQMLLGFNPMQYYAQTYEMCQYFAAHGYAVLSVNYRSGTGYGMEFRQAQHYGAFGGSEYLDIEGAVKWLKAQPFVDPKRIGAWGGSYGGYLTALALARDSADFAAGVDLHGVHDWSYELDLWKPTNDPAHNTAEAAKTAFAASPMADVKQWRSPVLLIQGDDDRNVLFGQTVRLAAALRAQGVHVEEKVFPDEVHDFLLHRNWVKAYELTADFFNRELKRQ